MVRAIWNGVVLAESKKTEIVEGNHYFPPESINKAYFKDSISHTTCPWKGMASYYTLAVNGDSLRDGAWYYPNPRDAAKNIRDHVAFYRSKGVTVVNE